MPRPSQEPKILDAALHCFARLGYDATRVTHIAETAGVSGGALYSHFRSKEDLARTLYTMHLERCSRELQSIAAEPKPLSERLRGCIRAGLALYRSDPDAFTFSLLRQHNFMPGLPANFVHPINVVEELIEEGQRENVIKDGDVKLIAAIFLGCVLRPVIVSQLAAPGSFDLLRDDSHDEVIVSSAWAAVAEPGVLR